MSSEQRPSPGELDRLIALLLEGTVSAGVEELHLGRGYGAEQIDVCFRHDERLHHVLSLPAGVLPPILGRLRGLTGTDDPEPGLFVQNAALTRDFMRAPLHPAIDACQIYFVLTEPVEYLVLRLRHRDGMGSEVVSPTTDAGYGERLDEIGRLAETVRRRAERT